MVKEDYKNTHFNLAHFLKLWPHVVIAHIIVAKDPEQKSCQKAELRASFFNTDTG